MVLMPVVPHAIPQPPILFSSQLYKKIGAGVLSLHDEEDPETRVFYDLNPETSLAGAELFPLSCENRVRQMDCPVECIPAPPKNAGAQKE